MAEVKKECQKMRRNEKMCQKMGKYTINKPCVNQAAQAVGLTNICAKHIIWICYPNPDKFSLAAAHH